jgi:OmpA-OmpF porin, OOP family
MPTEFKHVPVHLAQTNPPSRRTIRRVAGEDRARIDWPPMRSHRGSLLTALALFASSPAYGQVLAGGMALDQLTPTPAGDAFFGVPSPHVDGHLVPRALAMFAYASNPLTLDGVGANDAVVSQQAFLHIDASLALWDRLLVSVVVPVALVQGGDSPSTGEVTLRSPSSAQMGDVRPGLRVLLYKTDDRMVEIGAGTYFYIPSAPKDSFAGEGVFRMAPHVVAGGRFRRFVYTAAFGGEIRGSENPPTLTYGGGVGVLLWDDRVQVGPEIYASTVLQNAPVKVTATSNTTIPRGDTTNAEVLFGARLRVLGALVVGAAAGPGLTQAIGTPAFRALGTVGWVPVGSKAAASTADTDVDGVVDSEDACPFASGPKSSDPKKHGCPVVDRDEDGIVDDEDACPDVKGLRSAQPKANGCPRDRDGDGVPDSVDLCPDVAGDREKDGCPAAETKASAASADADGDGITDAADACPREKGAASKDAAANGCPKFVRVRGDEIALLAEVRFAVGKNDVVDKSSEAMLLEVRDVLAQHPEFAKVEVQAHTDDTGQAAYNVTLSKTRAEAVRKWLVDRGVPADRLVANGYGGEKPVADNKTAAGRAKNRRVSLVVAQKK